jgi:uncharacterized protein YaiI (UPF0178 family)
MRILVDADACPVKEEIFKVADRYDLPVTLVANQNMRSPNDERIKVIKVNDHLDAADDWIAEESEEEDIVVTADIPLASRCVKQGARVLSPNGKVFTESNIGSALATRDLLTSLRETGEITSGPPPFDSRARSQFLQELDKIIQSIFRDKKRQALLSRKKEK